MAVISTYLEVPTRNSNESNTGFDSLFPLFESRERKGIVIFYTFAVGIAIVVEYPNENDVSLSSANEKSYFYQREFLHSFSTLKLKVKPASSSTDEIMLHDDH